jgi:hypothetical protein
LLEKDRDGKKRKRRKKIGKEKERVYVEIELLGLLLGFAIGVPRWCRNRMGIVIV